MSDFSIAEALEELRHNGLRIIESGRLEQDGPPQTVRRTWRERWCSWPWRPWAATKIVVLKVPLQGALRLHDGTLVMHPDTARTLREMHIRRLHDPK